jgi:ribonuclease HII
MTMIWVCGVDEAGRGPLVGAVVAGAVVLDPDHPIVCLLYTSDAADEMD